MHMSLFPGEITIKTFGGKPGSTSTSIPKTRIPSGAPLNGFGSEVVFSSKSSDFLKVSGEQVTLILIVPRSLEL
jgi:hypothetical protein